MQNYLVFPDQGKLPLCFSEMASIDFQPIVSVNQKFSNLYHNMQPSLQLEKFDDRIVLFKCDLLEKNHEN